MQTHNHRPDIYDEQQPPYIGPETTKGIREWIKIVRAASSKYQVTCSGVTLDHQMGYPPGAGTATASGTCLPARRWPRSTPSMRRVWLRRLAAGQTINNPWTADEDMFLMAPDGLKVREKAKQLGRTYAACARRRHILKGRQQP